MFKRYLKYRNKKKELKPLFPVFRNGLYFYKSNKISKINLKSWYLFFLFPYICRVKSNIKCGDFTKAKICFGTQKVCAIIGDLTFCGFKLDKFYDRLKQTYENEIKNLNFPICGDYEFFDEIHIFRCNKAKGHSIKTKDEIEFALQNILNYNLSFKGKRIEDGVLMIISHGDCAPSNIFIDGDNLCFIDVGQAKLRPALFDFIYLCLISNNFMFLKTMQDKYKVTISQIFKDKNMRYDDSVFDDYLYCFCKYFEDLYSKINKPMDSKHILDIFKPLVCVECKIFPKTYFFIFSKFISNK